MLAKDAEQVLDHLQRAKIELHFAAADLGSHGVLAQYAEIEIAMLALDSAIAKLSAAIDDPDAPVADEPSPKAN